MILDVTDEKEAVVQTSDATLSTPWEQPAPGPRVGIRWRYAGCRVQASMAGVAGKGRVVAWMMVVSVMRGEFQVLETNSPFPEAVGVDISIL